MAESNLLEQLDKMAPLKEFDAFPKLPTTYKAKSEGRGFLTIFAVLLSLLLILNDVAEYVWGWPDTEFSVDLARRSYLPINVDLVVNMPCKYLSVDLRDAMGDRLHLSEGLKLDHTVFDLGQATRLQNHSLTTTAREVVRANRNTRGFFAWLSSSPSKPVFKPTFVHQKTGKAEGPACRIYGQLFVKKVTANLHITTLGHGYTSHLHTDHSMMNFSHVISEFSFGPYIPDIVQPLDYSYEVAQEPFLAYQYFLTVVPTKYYAPRSHPVSTNQYSVTHYVRPVVHGRQTPGIFFKFDVDPMQITVYQRTTSFLELVIRAVGVIGGVWVCMGWAVKIGGRAIEVVTGPPPRDVGIVAAEASSVAKRRWAGADLRSRRGGPTGSPYGSYTNTPVTAGFSPGPYSAAASGPYSAVPQSAQFPRSPPTADPYTPGFAPPPGSAPPVNSGVFPPSPLPGSAGFPRSPVPGSAGFPRSPMAPSGLRIVQGGLPETVKEKDD